MARVVTTWVTDLEKNFSSFYDMVRKVEDERCRQGTYGAEIGDLPRDSRPNIVRDAFKIKDELWKGLLVMFLPLPDGFQTIALLLNTRVLFLGREFLVPHGGEFLLKGSGGSVWGASGKQFGFRFLLCHGLTRQGTRGRVFIGIQVDGLFLGGRLSEEHVTWIRGIATGTFPTGGSGSTERRIDGINVVGQGHTSARHCQDGRGRWYGGYSRHM